MMGDVITPASRTADPLTDTRPGPIRRGAVGLRRAVVLIGAGFLVIAGATGAHAHSTLVSTDPADGSTVAVAPARITLTFNEPAKALGTQVVVLAPDGRTVSTGDAVLTDSSVSQAVAGDLPAGLYTVQWRVTSADGHPLDGTLTFTATGTTPSTTAVTAPAPHTTEDAAPAPGARPGPDASLVASATSTVSPGESAPAAPGAGQGGTAVAISIAMLFVMAIIGFVVQRRRHR